MFSFLFFTWYYKGLVAVCHSFCIYFSVYNSYIHTSFIHKHSLRPIYMWYYMCNVHVKKHVN
jgi:hypothetical protein